MNKKNTHEYTKKITQKYLHTKNHVYKMNDERTNKKMTY